MKVFVTGVAGQLGHDVVNELIRRGHEAIGSDIAPQYAGAQNGTAVTTAQYVQMDITDGEAVARVMDEACEYEPDSEPDPSANADAGSRVPHGFHEASWKVLPRSFREFSRQQFVCFVRSFLCERAIK